MCREKSSFGGFGFCGFSGDDWFFLRSLLLLSSLLCDDSDWDSLYDDAPDALQFLSVFLFLETHDCLLFGPNH